jgi:hypothetical protein
MPPPERPRAGIELAEAEDSPPAADDRGHADQPGAGRTLADRLARLRVGHPSAWPAPDLASAERRDPRRPDAEKDIADGQLPDGEVAGDEVAGEQEVADSPNDEPPPGEEAGLDELPDRRGPGSQAVPGSGGRPTAAGAGWSELAAPTARSPYRPWFSADGAGDPWFAGGP